MPRAQMVDGVLIKWCPACPIPYHGEEEIDANFYGHPRGDLKTTLCKRHHDAATSKVRQKNQHLLNLIKLAIGCQLAECPLSEQEHRVLQPDDLEFHHFDPVGLPKAFNLSAGANRFGSDRLLAEISKCSVVCKAAHRLVHVRPGSSALSETGVRHREQCYGERFHGPMPKVLVSREVGVGTVPYETESDHDEGGVKS